MSHHSPLHVLLQQQKRHVAGLMTGTSLDGVDVVLATLDGTGTSLSITLQAFASTPYPPALRSLLLANSEAATSSVTTLSQLNVRLAHLYAEALEQTLAQIGATFDDLDLIGSHGQTVHHIPALTPCADQHIRSTLQIGDPSTLANLTGVPVVGDFRMADMALGGQGAPLVPYFDYVYFTDAQETRGLLNLGGIANLTVLPKDARSVDVFAFDTGPSNMVVDALVQRFFSQPYDANGDTARQGAVNEHLLATMLEEVYLHQPPPKSTGREAYGTAYVDTLIAQGTTHQCSPHDLVATATAFTAASIHEAYQQFVASEHPLDVLIASGGGIHNAYLMDELRTRFSPIPVHTTADYGLNADAKEALCFAVLAHEYVNGTPSNMPSVTGAARPTLLGKLCLPGPSSGFDE